MHEVEGNPATRTARPDTHLPFRQAEFEARERALEHDIDHKPMDVHMEIAVSYNFLSK